MTEDDWSVNHFFWEMPILKKLRWVFCPSLKFNHCLLRSPWNATRVDHVFCRRLVVMIPCQVSLRFLQCGAFCSLTCDNGLIFVCHRSSFGTVFNSSPIFDRYSKQSLIPHLRPLNPASFPGHSYGLPSTDAQDIVVLITSVQLRMWRFCSGFFDDRQI